MKFLAQLVAAFRRLTDRYSPRKRPMKPQWIVNDLGELGVKVGGRFFFLYKGDNIEYGDEGNAGKDGIALHDDGRPMKWRIVGKREFGETCQPLECFRARWRDLYEEPLVYTPGLSDGKPGDGAWQPLPAKHQPMDSTMGAKNG